MEFPLFFQCGASLKTTVGGIASVGTARAVLDAITHSSGIIISNQWQYLIKILRVTKIDTLK